MQYQQTPHQTNMRRRHNNRNNQNTNAIVAALSVSTVLVLLAITFVGDWLRTPEVTASTLSPVFSPNNDLKHDAITLNYTLSEEADINIEVLDQAKNPVRNLLMQDAQPAGQYSVVWDGKDNSGLTVEDGHYNLSVQAKAAVRTATQNVKIELDTQAPPLQIANLPDGLRVGEDTLEIEGVTEANAIVIIGGDLQPVQVNEQGRFSISKKLSEGNNSFSIEASDQAGNSTKVQRGVMLITEAPEIIINSPQDGAWINNQFLSVSGQTTPNSMVSINGESTSTNDNGLFEYELLLDEGENNLQIEVIDELGNKTSLDRKVYLKTQAPVLSLNVKEGETFNTSILNLFGQTDSNTLIKINGNVVPVSSAGHFEHALALVEGENTIQVEAQDQTGNITSSVRHINYDIAQPLNGLEKLSRNLSELPPITLPLLVSIPIILAIFFRQQQKISMLLSVETDKFKPGFPYEQKNLSIYLDLDKSAHITLEVLGQHGRVVNTLLLHRRRSARVHNFYWNGYDDFGKLVQPGEYTIQATAGRSPFQVSSAIQITIQEAQLVHHAKELGKSTAYSYSQRVEKKTHSRRRR